MCPALKADEAQQHIFLKSLDLHLSELQNIPKRLKDSRFHLESRKLGNLQAFGEDAVLTGQMVLLSLLESFNQTLGLFDKASGTLLSLNMAWELSVNCLQHSRCLDNFGPLLSGGLGFGSILCQS